MKRRIMMRYLSGHYLANVVGAIVGLTALVQLLDLLDSATEVLDRKLGVSGLGTYMLLRMPATLDQVITLGVLIGGIVTFAQASRHREIVALRASGVTIYRIGFMLLPCAALMALLHVLVSDQLVPRSARALSTWWEASTPPGETNEDTENKPLWFRLGPEIVSVDRMLDGGQRLVGVHIYRRDENGALIGRTTATEARYVDGRWRLEGSTATSLAGDNVRTEPSGPTEWDVPLEPADAVDIGLPAARISSGASISALAGSGAANRAPSFYEMQIAEIYASAFAAFLMLLLSLPAAFSSTRDGKGGRLLILSLVLGLIFLLSNGVLNAFGESGALPPLVATWAALIIFAMAGTTLLLHLED